MKTKLFIFCLLIGSAYGQLVVPPVTATCATSVDGSVVLVPNPLNPPVVSAVYSGTLPAGTYFLEIVWYDASSHVTLGSPEVSIQLTGTGEIQVNPPRSGMPASAAGMKVYIGTTSGSETLQGSVASSGTYTQSIPLVTGAALPVLNTTVCQVIANDAGWPTGTGYNVTLTNPAGATLPGYPSQWQLLGPGNTINLGQGIPLYNGVVQYPSPILATPYGHATQSISGGLNLGAYPLTAGAGNFQSLFANTINGVVLACSTTPFAYQTIAAAHAALANTGGIIQTCAGHSENPSAFNISKPNTTLTLASNVTLTAAAVFPSWQVTAANVIINGNGLSSVFQGPSSGAGLEFQIGAPGTEVSGTQLNNFLINCGDGASPAGQRSGIAWYANNGPSSSDLTIQQCYGPFALFGDGVHNTNFSLTRLHTDTSYSSGILISTNATDGILDSPRVTNSNTGADGAGIFVLDPNTGTTSGIIRIDHPSVALSGNNALRFQRDNIVVIDPQLSGAGNLEGGVSSTGDGLRIEANNISVVGGYITGGGTGGGGDCIKIDDAGPRRPNPSNITVTGTILNACKNHGFDVTGTIGSPSSIYVTNVQSYANTGNGYRLNRGSNIYVSGGSAVGNSQWGIYNTQNNVSVCNVDLTSTANTNGTMTNSGTLLPCTTSSAGISMPGATSGTSTLTAPATGGGANTLPAAAGALCTAATCTLGTTGIQFVPPGSNTAAIQAILNAVTAGQEVDFTGTYTACGLTLTVANVRLRGLSTDGAVIQCATANSPVLTVSGAADEVIGLKLTHITNSPTCPGGNGTATCGDGLQVAGGATRVKLENVHTNFNYNGLALGYTTYSELSDSVTEFNNNHGVVFVMDATHKNMQWQVSRVLTEQNLGNGFDMTCPAAFTNVQTPGPYITGWTAAFGNVGNGFNFSCSAATTSGIADVWMSDVFATQNNASGFRVDAGPNGGRNFILNNIYSEQTGTYTGTAGFASATQTATNVGYGIEITSSCDPTSPPIITGATLWANSYSGGITACAGTSVANLDTFNNGAASASAQTEAGFTINAAQVSVTGGFHKKGTTQIYGTYLLGGDTPAVTNPVCDAGIGIANCVFSGTQPTNGYQQWIGQVKYISGSGVPAMNCGVGWNYDNIAAASLATVHYVCYPANTWNAVTIP